MLSETLPRIFLREILLKFLRIFLHVFFSENLPSIVQETTPVFFFKKPFIGIFNNTITSPAISSKFFHRFINKLIQIALQIFFHECLKKISKDLFKKLSIPSEIFLQRLTGTISKSFPISCLSFFFKKLFKDFTRFFSS